MDILRGGKYSLNDWRSGTDLDLVVMMRVNLNSKADIG